MSQQNHTQL